MMRVKRGSPLLGACVLGAACLQAGAQGGDPCHRQSIMLNSGFEHDGLGGGSVYPLGSLDAYYQVIHDPDPGTSEPRPAGVIPPYPSAWAAPQPNSQWLGAYPGPEAILNGFYVFQVCFCLDEGFQDVALTIACRADDAVNVYLNETLNDVLTSTATPVHVGQGHPPGPLTTTVVTNQALFRPGRNCIMFRVENIGSVAMGLNSVVSLTCANGLAEDPTCCSNGSTIAGVKFNDLNGNGVRDSGEPVLPGWTINLSPGGATATTDSNGHYYFTGLNPGAYTITETNQSGWVQTSPAGGSYSIDLPMNVALDGFDFGNMFDPCGTLNDVSIDCEVGPQGWTGCYLYTFTFTNLTNVTVAYILVADPNVPQHIIPLPTPVAPNGTSGPVTIKICPPADGAPCYPVHLALADAELEECCTLDKCVELPDCSCMLFLNPVLTPTEDAQVYSLTFSIQNMTPDVIEHMFIVPEPPSAFGIVSPDYIDVPTTPPGGFAGPFKVDLGAFVPGHEYCIRVSIHNESLAECCSKVLCFETPEAAPCPPDLAEPYGQLDFSDVIAFLAAFAAMQPAADLAPPFGVWDFSDVVQFLTYFGQGCP
ncbi:MAG: SdrD B-like domain-containing protein [Phycisphaerales bacterium]